MGACTNTDLTYLGVVAISDPVRADVPAVQSCLNAAIGIDVKIVTGDTPGTAKEIGHKSVSEAEDTDRNIITGPGFEALTDEGVGHPGFENHVPRTSYR